MNKERLLSLIDVLTNKVTDEQFDIDSYLKESSNTCCTVGCAAGWYAFHNPQQFIMKYGYLPFLKSAKKSGLLAMEIYFELTHSQTYDIFIILAYKNKNVTRHDVIQRINLLLESENTFKLKGPNEQGTTT